MNTSRKLRTAKLSASQLQARRVAQEGRLEDWELYWTNHRDECWQHFRTVRSLIKHGYLERFCSAYARITPKGLAALAAANEQTGESQCQK